MNNMRRGLLRKGRIIIITLLLAITTTTAYGSLGVGWSSFSSGPELANEAGTTSIESSNETVYQTTKKGTAKGETFLYREPTKDGETILKMNSGAILNIHSLVKLDGIEWYKVLHEGSWAFVTAEDVQVEDERQTGLEKSPLTKEEADNLTDQPLNNVAPKSTEEGTPKLGGASETTPPLPNPDLLQTYYSPHKTGIVQKWTEVRNMPANSGSIITNFEPKRKLTVYSMIQRADGTKWYKTTYGGKWAYLPIEGVAVYESRPIENRYDPHKVGILKVGTPARTRPESSSSIAGNLRTGRKMTIYGEVDYLGAKWYKTTYGGKWVYLPVGNVAVYESTPVENRYDPHKAGIITVGTTAWSKPSTTASRVANLQAGRKMTIYGEVSYLGKKWYKTTYGGKWAYLPAGSVYMGDSKYYQNPAKYRQISIDPIPVRASNYTLKVGMSGMKVYKIQKYLGIYNGKAYYGSYTAEVVKGFQRKWGLPVTGQVDYATWRKMGFSWNDFYYLDSYVSPMLVNIESPRSTHVEAMVTTAQKYVGTKYVWCASAAPGVGVDCTGLIFQALYGAGIDPAPLGSHSYAYWSHQYSSRLLWADKSYLHVSYANRERGDIIVYGSGGVVNHVALYLGNNRIIDAMPGRGVGYNNAGAYGIIGVIRPLV